MIVRLSLSFLLVVSACAGPALELHRVPMYVPIVERLSASSVLIRWPESFSRESVAIYGGPDPQQIDRSTPLAISNQRSVQLTEKLDPEINERHRMYYELVPLAGGQPTVVTERRLPLECCDNFRDLGGYPAANGKPIRWNRLYRSGELSGLTGSDLAYLSQLDIKLVCDFRSDRERAADPDRPIDASAEQVDLPVDQKGVDPDEMQRKIRTGGMAALAVEQTMIDAYRAFVTDYTDDWAQMFERLMRAESYPALVHCTAGKDRTGFASALVMLAVGVPVEAVFEDYLLTNHYTHDFVRFVLRWAPLYSFFRTDQEDLLPLLLAKREYLQASLDTIVERHGSIDAYLDTLGMTPARRERLAVLIVTDGVEGND